MSTSNNKPNIPFVLRYKSAEDKMFSAISESVTVEKIPFFLLEGILTNILHQVREQAQAEKENAKALYEQQLAECEKEGEENGE